MMRRLKGAFILSAEAFELIYGIREREQIADLVELTGPPVTRDAVRPELLREIEVLFSGWDPPRFDAAFLKAAPQLKVVFYGAGTIESMMTQEAWDRGIQVTSAYGANAVAVAEYCLGAILFSLKHGWHFAREARAMRTFPERHPVPGAYGSTIGLVSMGMIGRKLRELLRAFHLRVIAYDPFLSAAEAEELDIGRVSTEELFARSDVVSLHTPLLAETRGLIGKEHLLAMRPGATLINTARGAVIRQEEMLDVLSLRPDLQAVLDVADPEPPPATSRIYDLPNVVLTPHIAGSRNAECQRMGAAMVEELQRYVKGEPLQWGITPALAHRSSHRLMEIART